MVAACRGVVLSSGGLGVVLLLNEKKIRWSVL